MIEAYKGLGRLALAGVLSGLLGAGHALANAEPPPGTVSLWEQDKGDRRTLKFNEQWGWLAQYPLKSTDAAIPANKARFVAFNNIPSASRIVLSSDELCQQTEDTGFWIELVAKKEHANYPIQGDDPALPMATLMQLQLNQLYGGLQVVNKHQKPGASLDDLACVRMVTSRTPGQEVPDVPIAVNPGLWIPAPGAEDNLCTNTSGVLTGHKGAEKAAGRCADTQKGLRPGAPAPERPRTVYKAGFDVCPTHTAITGFGYRVLAKEYGYTLACQSLLDAQDRPLQVLPISTWHGPFEDEDYEFTCPGSTVLVGRKSVGDGRETYYPFSHKSWYLCGEVKGYRGDSRAMNTAKRTATGSLLFWSPVNPRDGTRTEFAMSLDGAGTTRQYELRNHGVVETGDKKANDNVEELAMHDIPSATRITFTDDAVCDSTKGDFAVTLKAWKEGSSLTPIKISDLGANDLGYPVGDGLRLEARRGQPARDKLSCIKVELSRQPGQAVPDTPVLVTGNGAWQTFKESDHDFSCQAGVLTGAARKGDENGSADYRCGALPTLAFSGEVTFEGITESGEKARDENGEEHGDRLGFWVMCPFDKVMVGRGHQGDENGKSRYTCATVTQGNQALAVRPDPTWTQVGAQHQFSCDAGKVLVGRWHQGDENGPTAYRCGTLLR